jgi:putative nucleotidyltransferase with HDIG domain
VFKSLLGILGANKPKASKELTYKKLSPATKDNIFSVVGARAITAMPGAAQKAFALASNPKAEARDFVDVIESDEALSARVIKIANSVFFDRGQKSSSIDEAVVVIGLNELRNLLNANALADIFKTSNPARAQLWAHDIAVALSARQLAQRFLPRNADSAFLAGLMHDIGKLLLIQRCPEEYSKILAKVEQEDSDFISAEAEIFPFDHCEVGQLIAEKWSFSEELTKVISLHHQVNFDVESKNMGLLEIVSAANIISHSLGLGFSPKFSRLRIKNQAKLELIWTYLGLPLAEQTSFLDILKRNFESEYELYAGKFGA